MLSAISGWLRTMFYKVRRFCMCHNTQNRPTLHFMTHSELILVNIPNTGSTQRQGSLSNKIHNLSLQKAFVRALLPELGFYEAMPSPDVSSGKVCWLSFYT
jgi:hypothetical protein